MSTNRILISTTALVLALVCSLVSAMKSSHAVDEYSMRSRPAPSVGRSYRMHPPKESSLRLAGGIASSRVK